MSHVNRIKATLSKQQAGILSPYITAGYPSIEATLPLMHRLVEAGADILELGMPFSDPMAEGVVIQKAMEVALDNGMTQKHLFDIIKKFRETDNDTPIVLMGYLNTIEVSGYEAFAEKAELCGVDATIIVDLPVEESETVLPIWQAHNLEMIYLCSPTTSNERLSSIKNSAGSYIYYVSLKGVTGANTIDSDNVKEQYLAKKQQLQLPMLVGFGIKTPEMAKEISQFADGVVVGAALIEKLDDDNDAEFTKATAFIRQLRQAIDEKS